MNNKLCGSFNRENKSLGDECYTRIEDVEKCLSLFKHKYNHNGNYELNYYKGKEYKYFKYTDVPLGYKGEALLAITFDDHYLCEYPNLEIIELCNRPVTDKDGRVLFTRLLVNFR